jgi:hypothetical protein
MRVMVIPATLLAVTFALCLILNSFSSAQGAPKAHVRLFNDSTRAVNFYIDGQFSCAVKANRDGNEAFCDTYEAKVGKHTISIKGVRLRGQSCELYVADRGFAELGAEAHLSKGELLHCMSFGTVD